jgi:DNA-directed RNA polymerase subunit RPC12/RpoP
MTNIDNQTFEIRCPSCGCYNTIRYKQARLQEVINCQGCGSKIQLIDEMNTFQNVKQEFEKNLKNLNKKIKI